MNYMILIFVISSAAIFVSYLGQILGQILDTTTAAPTIAPIIIVSISFSPSFIDILYHDILSLSLFIYLPWQNNKL